MKSRKENSLKEKLFNKLRIKLESNLLSTVCSDPIIIDNFKIIRRHNLRLAIRIRNSTLIPYVYKE